MHAQQLFIAKKFIFIATLNIFDYQTIITNRTDNK